MAHNSKPKPSTDYVGHRRPIIQHGSEISVGSAEPRNRRDILDRDNAGPDFADVLPGSPGSGAAPGSSGIPTTGGPDDGGIPVGMS
jgi:hypothetical protein